ncbi:unnamed protein product [Eretmochelys imbricata]
MPGKSAPNTAGARDPNSLSPDAFLYTEQIRLGGFYTCFAPSAQTPAELDKDPCQERNQKQTAPEGMKGSDASPSCQPVPKDSFPVTSPCRAWVPLSQPLSGEAAPQSQRSAPLPLPAALSVRKLQASSGLMG